MPLAPGALARIAVPNPHARVLELVGEVSGQLDPDEFCDGLFAALQAALPSDYVSLNQVASEPERNWSVSAASARDLQSVEHHHRQARVIQPAAINSSMAVRVFSMNISDTGLLTRT